MPEFSPSEEVRDPARPWQWRVLRASLPTTTGIIMRSMLGQNSRKGICFNYIGCDISEGGMCWVQARHGQVGAWRWTRLGDIKAVRDNVRKLADHCHLNDAERNELFDHLKRWIRKDARATSTGEFHGNASV